MKKLLRCLGASLMAIGSVSGIDPAPAKINCGCQNCPCAQEKHCGCLSKTPSASCQCGENGHCGMIETESGNLHHNNIRP